MNTNAHKAKQQVLCRDGIPVIVGTNNQILQWIHNNHCYSYTHALKNEGYSVHDCEE